jgi:hypothetical protein
VQSVLQQMPGPVAVSFTQCAFWHSAFAAHGWPSSFGPQLPFTHAIPSAHSALVVHLLLHAPLRHLNCPHSWIWAGWQVPRPSQERAVFTAVAVAQVAGPQGVSAGYRLQVPKPSQTPVLPQVVAAILAHIGWPWPAGVGMQVPGAARELQVRQAPPHALLQQMPLPLTMSAQKVEAQSSPLAQTAPFIFLPQLPFTHLRPATQSASLEQTSKQALVERLQERGAQTVVVPSLHTPAPSQVYRPVTASASQAPALQTVPAS